MKKLVIPDQLEYIQADSCQLNEYARIMLKKRGFFISIYKTIKSKNFKILYDPDETSFMSSSKEWMDYQLQVARYIYTLPDNYPYIVHTGAHSSEASSDAFQFYYLCDDSQKPKLALFFFENEQNFVTNLLCFPKLRDFMLRYGYDFVEKFNYGKRVLIENQEKPKDAYFLSVPNWGFLFIPINSDQYDKFPDWRNFEEKDFDSFCKETVAEKFKVFSDSAFNLQVKYLIKGFITSDGNIPEFNSASMQPCYIDAKDLTEENQVDFFKSGLAINLYNMYVPKGIDYNVAEDYNVIEYFQYCGSLMGVISGLAYYDITWMDRSHAFACKIPVSMEKLLSIGDLYMLESKLPSLMKYIKSGMMGEEKNGAIYSNDNNELIFIYPYEGDDPGHRNVVHMKCLNWLKQLAYEWYKFFTYIECKEGRDSDKERKNTADMFTRISIVEGIRAVLGG